MNVRDMGIPPEGKDPFSPDKHSGSTYNVNISHKGRNTYQRVLPTGQCAPHQWRRIPPGELSINPVVDKRLGRVTERAGSS
jgi:hypothetical protein